MKFAGPLKNMTRALLHDIGLSHEVVEQYVEGHLKEKEVPGLGVTSRKLQITLGTGWGRNLIADDFWVRVAFQKITALLAAGTSVVIDDLRFPNEYDALMKLDAHFVKVSRPGYSPTMESEGLLEKLPSDFVIINDGTLFELRRWALDIKTQIEGGFRYDAS